MILISRFAEPIYSIHFINLYITLSNSKKLQGSTVRFIEQILCKNAFENYRRGSTGDTIILVNYDVEQKIRHK